MKKSELRQLIREEIKRLGSVTESYGNLDGGQSDALEGTVLYHSDKKDKEILKILKKDPLFKGVKDRDLLEYIADVRAIFGK